MSRKDSFSKTEYRRLFLSRNHFNRYASPLKVIISNDPSGQNNENENILKVVNAKKNNETP